MKFEPLQSNHVRGLNSMSVYRVLKSNRELTRADIAKTTSLSVPTVTTIVQGFVDAGIVVEVGQARSGGGRPPRLVRLQPEARHVFAVDLSGMRVRAALVDLLGNLCETLDGPEVKPGIEVESWTKDVLKTFELRRRNVAKLAVAVPGVIDPSSGRVHLAPAVAWDDYPLAQNLERATGLGCVLENDVNALAVAELHYGTGRKYRHVIYISIGSGIGAGLVLNGKLYRGAHAAAGEVGYSILPHLSNQGAFNLGLPGPLERYLLKLSRSFIRNGQVVVEDETAAMRFAEFAEELAVILHNAACLLDPELLVIAWQADREGKLVSRLKELWRGVLPVQICQSTLGQEAALRGVAHLALERVEKELCRSSGFEGIVR